MLTSLLRAEDVAAILNVKASTIREWARMRFIPSVQLGRCVRFDKDAVTKWLDDRKKAGRVVRIPL